MLAPLEGAPAKGYRALTLTATLLVLAHAACAVRWTRARHFSGAAALEELGAAVATDRGVAVGLGSGTPRGFVAGAPGRGAAQGASQGAGGGTRARPAPSGDAPPLTAALAALASGRGDLRAISALLEELAALTRHPQPHTQSPPPVFDSPNDGPSDGVRLWHRPGVRGCAELRASRRAVPGRRAWGGAGGHALRRGGGHGRHPTGGRI